jgi:broad specificity phosphatase PhoE
VARRCLPAIGQILATPGSWVVLAHAGVFRVVLHELLGIPFGETFRRDPGYGQFLDLGRLGDSVFFDGKEYFLPKG